MKFFERPRELINLFILFRRKHINFCSIQRDPKLFFKKFETKKIDHASRLREHLARAVNRAPHAVAAPAAPVTPPEPVAAVPARAILLHTLGKLLAGYPPGYPCFEFLKKHLYQ